MESVQHKHVAPVRNNVFNKIPSWDQEYEGYVIDRIDPKGVGRVKVFIPELMEDQDYEQDQGIWVRTSKEHDGTFIVPSLNTWVVVRFLYGNPQLGYVVRVMSSVNEHPPRATIKYKPPDSETCGSTAYPKTQYTTNIKYFEKKYCDAKFSQIEINNLPDFYVYSYAPKNKSSFVINDGASDYLEISTDLNMSLYFSDTYSTYGILGGDFYSHLLFNMETPFTEYKLGPYALKIDPSKDTTYLKGANSEVIGFSQNKIVISNTINISEDYVETGSQEKNRLNSVHSSHSVTNTDDFKSSVPDAKSSGRSIMFDSSGIYINAMGSHIKILDNGKVYIN